MTFLNPGLLLGLFAIAIPILIHLLNLRKIRKVDFSTLMFLKEIQKSKMRRIKLKQLLLLLLRILAIVFLVLSFSDPVYDGVSGNRDNGNVTAVIVIDDSYSMTARDDKGQYLDQAKDAVNKILESHNESDKIYFIKSSDPDKKYIDQKYIFDNFRELKDSLEKVNSSLKKADIPQIMNFASEIFENSGDKNKELYLISDFQKNNFDNSDQMFFENMSDFPVNVFLVKTGSRIPNNLSLDSFSIETKILEKDKDTRVKIFLNNHSKYNVRNKTVNLYIDNVLVSEKAADAVSFEKKEMEFNFKPERSGFLRGMIELVQSEFGDDELSQDNKYYFTLYIPGKFNIGILEDPSRDQKYIELAIRSASQILSDSINRNSELFEINLFGSISNGIFGNDIIFISGKNNFTDNEAVLLNDYITRGGGVFMFPGSNADINNYNNVLFSKINSVKFGKLNSDENINSNLKFERINFENPLLSEVFSNKGLNETSDRFNVESPVVRSYYELIGNQNSNAVITFSNDRPFLIESDISAGKIIISSLPLSPQFSDLTAKSIFLPLIIRSIYYLSNNFSYQTEYIAGRSNLLTLNKPVQVTGIITPAEDRFDFKNQSALLSEEKVKGNYFFLPYLEETKEAGIYELADSSENKYLFALNGDPEESNPDVYNEDEILEYFKSPGINTVRFIDDNAGITSEIETAETGLSLWKYFLLGAVLFILGEMFLSKRIENS
ncbi:MAG TPA: BatA and WFA domain-containing protein [Ignavibacteria bacterium]|nr:BatA and WFA domain-containing protein [Ignavibacteria bacterium]